MGENQIDFRGEADGIVKREAAAIGRFRAISGSFP